MLAYNEVMVSQTFLENLENCSGLRTDGMPARIQTI